MTLVAPQPSPPAPTQVPTIGRVGDRTLLVLHGDHDSARLKELRYAIAKAISLDDRDLVVDLSDVGFICAGTIGTLVRTRAMLDSLSRTCTFRSPSAHTQKILAICGVGWSGSEPQAA
jgi:anti-anti-sigma regulatory factor